jgi:preprotein translocase subunit SecG
MWTTVLLVVHLMIAAALVGVVLLQRSEGGALGIGGGGGGGFMTGRGTANLLTRVTAGLAAAFFATSIGLTLLANQGTSGGGGSVFDRVQVPAPAGSATPGATPASAPADAPKAAEPAKAPEVPRGGVLDKLEQGKGEERLPKK